MYFFQLIFYLMKLNKTLVSIVMVLYNSYVAYQRTTYQYFFDTVLDLSFDSACNTQNKI